MSIRHTGKRNKILKLLERHYGTLSAADIHEQLPDIDLVTIYRNLDLFVKEKMIKKIHLGTGETQYEYQNEPHHHAVCTNCRKVRHFVAPDKKIKRLLELEDFQTDEIEITIRGVCTHKKSHSKLVSD